MRISFLRVVALPLSLYWLWTLGVPLANGAPLSSAFLRHARIILLVGAGVAAGCGAVLALVRVGAKRYNSRDATTAL